MLPKSENQVCHHFWKILNYSVNRFPLSFSLVSASVTHIHFPLHSLLFLRFFKIYIFSIFVLFYAFWIISSDNLSLSHQVFPYLCLISLTLALSFKISVIIFSFLKFYLAIFLLSVLAFHSALLFYYFYYFKYLNTFFV